MYIDKILFVIKFIINELWIFIILDTLYIEKIINIDPKKKKEKKRNQKFFENGQKWLNALEFLKEEIFLDFTYTWERLTRNNRKRNRLKNIFKIPFHSMLINRKLWGGRQFHSLTSFWSLCTCPLSNLLICWLLLDWENLYIYFKLYN